MTHLTGYYVLLLGRGEGRPVAWFENMIHAIEFVDWHGSPSFKLEIAPAPVGDSPAEGERCKCGCGLIIPKRPE